MKAFSNIKRQMFWNILHWAGIPYFLTEVIKCMYDGSRICFKTNIGKYLEEITSKGAAH
jgi:hypothetical protein